jgi:diguanylate cyclase (GGDEF)-like protein
VLTQDVLLAVILAAISLNLLLAIAILLTNRLRGRAPDGAGRSRFDRASLAGLARSSSGAGSASGSTFVPPPHGQHQSDPQTGLELAATWERWLAEEDARMKRYRRPATVVLVEIEGIDRLIERLGPPAADRLVPPVAATMRKYGREADRIARLDRARFGAILAETDEVAAINYVERVRTAADLWLAAGAVTLRLAIGWAEANGAFSIHDAARTAEERLNAERRKAAAAAGETLEGRIVEPAVG